MKRIVIEFIPHKEQRYETVGDYWHDGDTLNIRVSDMGNDLYNELVAIHELVEELLTRNNGISENEIMEFDIMWDQEVKHNIHHDVDEPGYDVRSPYYNEHFFAESIERLVANKARINWKQYEDTVFAL